MDWFERLTGFREQGYDSTRSQLAVQGRELVSRVNGRRYGIGELELVSLGELRARAQAAGGLPGRLRVSVVQGDVRTMHQSPENSGALFQVASQFNLLEMVSPDVTPEQGVTRYQHDRTQGPACAMAVGAATIYRNYFADVDGVQGQTAGRQLDGLADIGTALCDALGRPVAQLWTMRNSGRCATGMPCVPSPDWMPSPRTSSRQTRAGPPVWATCCGLACTGTWRLPVGQARQAPASPRPFARRCPCVIPPSRRHIGVYLRPSFCALPTRPRCGLPCAMHSAQAPTPFC